MLTEALFRRYAMSRGNLKICNVQRVSFSAINAHRSNVQILDMQCSEGILRCAMFRGYLPTLTTLTEASYSSILFRRYAMSRGNLKICNVQRVSFSAINAHRSNVQILDMQCSEGILRCAMFRGYLPTLATLTEASVFPVGYLSLDYAHRSAILKVSFLEDAHRSVPSRRYPFSSQCSQRSIIPEGIFLVALTEAPSRKYLS